MGASPQLSALMVTRIVNQIDHLWVPLRDPTAAHSFLAEQLQLPVAWPYMEDEVSGTGGVSLGNVNLESLKENEFTGYQEEPARIRGIAFEPALDVADLLVALDQRGIAHGPARPYPEGAANPYWTNVNVDVTEGTFFCKYRFDAPARRKVLDDALIASGGGPLGIIRVDELVIGSSDTGASVERWQALLDPVQPTADCFEIGDGPRVRLVPSDRNCIEHLVVLVRSLDRAATAARSLDIRLDDATLVIEQLGGLRLLLREALTAQGPWR